MRYLSVCSGIEAATVAWEPLGFEPLAFAEIEPFPAAVLAHHYPDTPNLGDLNDIDGAKYRGACDLLVGGTPCQSFSVAGLRGGLADDRGNLALQFVRLAAAARPRVVLWENVPGVLSSGGGRDFGSIVGALEELGYGWAYRTLDAQYFGVPQRRRRVFLVGHLGGAECAREVLFERESLRGDSPPSREARETAPTIPSRSSAGGGLGTDFDCDGGLIPFDTTQITSSGNYSAPRPAAPCHPLASGAHAPAVAFALNGHGGAQGRLDAESETLLPVASPILANAGRTIGGGGKDSTPRNLVPCTPKIRAGCEGGGKVLTHHAVRRLTPRECERLQGFPDDYTPIPWRKGMAPDGPRYKALGNSMAVPVMRWIGKRIARVAESRGEG